MSQSSNHYDVVIIGAGLSGIGAAYYLQKYCPERTYKILEMRDSIGGTWDYFKYPGLRSDSDMYTFGYSFKPWKNPKAIADGASILAYIKETAAENQIDQHIQYNQKVHQVAWSTDDAAWTIDVESEESYSCNFLFACSGYYNYEEGYTPKFEGRDLFKGTIIHPQKWPEGYDYSDQNIVVIGSGATAVTLVPELAKKAAHVTMLQRSPTYIANMPEQDVLANVLKKILPAKAAYFIARWKNILVSMAFFNLCRKFPKTLKKVIVGGAKKALNDDIDALTHFNPRYNPWDERLCAVPDNDLFESLNEGGSSVVTDHIDRFDESGVVLKSGKKLEADMIVTATGLKMELFAGIKMIVDGREINAPDHFVYRGMMFSDVPNFAQFVGYTNASWTLKSDLTGMYACRLLNHMKEHGLKKVTPRNTDDSMEREPIIDFSSGYVKRALDILPKQGTKKPWKLYQNYIKDYFSLRYSKLSDGHLEMQ